MKKIAISIPNYNRIDSLGRLIRTIISEISKDNLTDLVQICISDDCSNQDPTKMIEEYITNYPDIDIRYFRNPENLGMSSNFVNSVMISNAEYCWIIGNDDMIEPNGIRSVLDYFNQNDSVDFLVTPFDVYLNNTLSGSIHPLSDCYETVLDTSELNDRIKLFSSVIHNSGVFGFLSNVVFRRNIWIEKRELFADKMDTLFIQMYIDISALFSGARYGYMDRKIIRNNTDDLTNNTVDRISGVLFGLADIVDYFFKQDYTEHFKKVLIDPFINDVLWDTEKDSKYYKKISSIASPKNDVYKTYFVRSEERLSFFENKNIIVYGAGNYGHKAYERLKRINSQIVGVADSDCEKEGKRFEELTILSVEDMIDKYYEKKATIVVANHHNLVEMVSRLKQQGIQRIAVIT